MLVVFTKFLDDQHPGDPNVDARQWPLDLDPHALPAFANSLVSRDPLPTLDDSTLTAYFYQQSNGKLSVTGDVFPSVLVTNKAEKDYHRPNGGYGELTVELLTRIDDTGVDFRRYDRNRDGVVDQIFIILRRDSKRDEREETYTGISCLDARCGGRLTASKTALPSIVLDGTLVDWNRSGSYLFNRVAGNIIPNVWLVRLMAHELGHDLWIRHFNHIPGLSDNVVPLADGKPQNTVGYVLMAGAGGAVDAGGSLTISAFERLLLDWIDCPELLRAGRIYLGDLYWTGDCRLVNYKMNEKPRTLVLSNLQRRGYFDKYRRGGHENQFELGLLRTTGLLAQVTDGRRLDVLPADMDLTLSNSNADYDGDLFGSPGSSQLTPWTSPSATGYQNGIDPEHRWMAIDNIRMDSSGSVVFDFIPDFRHNTIFREPSVIDQREEESLFSGEMRLTAKGRVSIRSDAALDGKLVLDSGSEMIVESGATLTITKRGPLVVKSGATLIVRGILAIGGPVVLSPGSHLNTRNGSMVWLR